MQVSIDLEFFVQVLFVYTPRKIFRFTLVVSLYCKENVWIGVLCFYCLSKMSMLTLEKMGISHVKGCLYYKEEC